MAIDKLACHYTKCNSTGNNGKTLTITVDFTYIPTGAVAKLNSIRETSSGTKYISSHTISNHVGTIVQYNFGNSNSASMTFIPINAGNSANALSYTDVITLQ